MIAAIQIFRMFSENFRSVEIGLWEGCFAWPPHMNCLLQDLHSEIPNWPGRNIHLLSVQVS
jgi:hypothetical protein